MTVKLIWSTPNAEEQIAYMARVSNPDNQDNPSIAGLISYLIKHKHWSPFEMANMCVEINTTRDIARQILRHRSFTFQEFSQRYADVSLLGEMVPSECRLQDPVNRQNSIPVSYEDSYLEAFWDETQKYIWDQAVLNYKVALSKGVAKEVARKLLPEGLTPSRMYMNGTLRSWLHYFDTRARMNSGTQREHMRIAQSWHDIFSNEFPNVNQSMQWSI